ncbi:hypothetical protein diail_9735 [Diaporthe ilicicola]|nr:hypothetical protein diail_9735 [Diaporthe ilicicola]
MYTAQCSHAVLQAEGVQFVPFAGATRADRSLFYKMDWVLSEPNGASAASGIAVKNEDKQFHRALSRVAAYYLRKFDTDVPDDSPARNDHVLSRYLDYARHMTDLVYSGKHKYCEKEWLSDTIEQVMEHVKQSNFQGRADMRLAILIGETMPRVFRRETTMIEHMRTSGLLDEYYSSGFGMRQSSAWLSQSLKQITDRHPHLNILEVGAGTGSATKDILSRIGDSFSTFTFTDISSSFFGDAAEGLKTWNDRMIFKVFDLERSPAEQGFKEGAYDVIVASFVIHATSRLRDTMRHLRKLLRPGGYLVVGEGTSNGPLQAADGFIFGTLPGWWLGVTEGRTWTPFINLDQWDDLLKETGFSGIQSTPPSEISDVFGLALFIAQADDARLSFLREPLASTGVPEKPDMALPTLTLIGGMTATVGKIVQELQATFKKLQGVGDVKHYEALTDIDSASLDESDGVISLMELDFHSFESMTQSSWESFKNLFETGKTLLWVSTGRLADRPWANMPVGFGRTAVNETSGLDLQFLDFESMDMVDSRKIAQAFVRLRAHRKYSDNLLWTKETEIIIDHQGNHRNLVSNERPKSPLAIVDWTSSTTVPVRLWRLDAPGGVPLFKDKKTYWVCGMSGALGISVCDWMVESGAKYIVITSRNPKIENEWVQSHLRGGVSVKIICCDVTDEQALQSVHYDICQTMPPIAGVMNGAMVLRDKSIPNMGYEDVVDVVNPKVLGSIYLDRIFYNTNLDFFILISSITAVVGNVGQANYAAANMHMCALAANRRKRGLNAVALNGGAIIGAGYITRETDRALDLTVEKMALMRLSEEDFHQMIAEAIEAGRVDSPDGLSEITTGLLEVAPDSPNIPKWYRDPKFSRFIVQSTTNSEEMTDQTAAASIHDLLQSCDTFDNLILLVRNFLSEQLRKLLMIPRDVLDEVILSKGSSELGLDSLISVDLRSWCLKNFKAIIPVLKIMSIDSIEDLVSSIVGSIPSEMIPSIPVAFETDEGTGDISITTTVTSTHLGPITESVFSSLNSPKEQSPINWESESTPPADLADLSEVLTIDMPISTPPKLIVVTGVTGHLGSHLLRHLLADTESDIYCLAVRRVSERLRMKQLPVSPRVRYYEGDLAHPLLGLSRETADSIFARADAVIHNGANTSHVKVYRELRAVNVGSTIALVRLCLPRRVPMHYISSAGVCIFYSQDTFPPVSVTSLNSLLPASDGSFGYASSKWVNERLLERVYEEYRLPVYVYRPSTIIREGADAIGPQAELDWVNALLQYTRKIGAAPEVRYNRGALDLVRTETCCAGVVGRVLRGAAARGEKIEYFNQVGDAVIPIDSIRDMDAKERKRYDVLPLAEWLKKSMEAGLHPGVAHLIQKMNDPAIPSYPRLLK